MTLQHWTPETRDAMALADQLAKLVAECSLRRAVAVMEKASVKITVEVRR